MTKITNEIADDIETLVQFVDMYTEPGGMIGGDPKYREAAQRVEAFLATYRD